MSINVFFSLYILYHCCKQFLHSIKNDDTTQFAWYAVEGSEKKNRNKSVKMMLFAVAATAAAVSNIPKLYGK